MYFRPHASRSRFGLVFVAILAAVASAAAVGPAHAGTKCTPNVAWGTNRTDLAATVVSLINDYRTEHGLSQLAVSSSLTASSEWKSLNMAGTGYFDHADPAPYSRSAYQRVKICGFAGGWWGENIAAGFTTPRSAVNGWLRSSGHRANIENPHFTSTGVGVAVSAAGTFYWTQSFGDDVVARAPAAPEPSASVTSNSTLELAIRPAQVTRSQDRSKLVAWIPFERTTKMPVTADSMTCRATIASRRLAVVAKSVAPTGARCTWRVPSDVAGKQIAGVVALRAGETVVTRRFARSL